jgi:hypothetical protein
VPLIEHCSNGQFGVNLDILLHDGGVEVPVRHRPRLCQCDCGQPVTCKRKFVNQDHYTVWLTLVQYPQWKSKRPANHER